MCLARELSERGLFVERQEPLPVSYQGHQIQCGYRLGLPVERRVIVELKAVGRVEFIHEARMLSYLKLAGCQVGLLINFNVRHLKNGIRRYVNALPE